MLQAEQNFSFLLFGASGHLAKIKIFPAFYFLALKKRLPKEYNIVGYARTKMTDEQFRKEFADAVKEYVEEVNEKVLEELLTHVVYQRGNYDNAADFSALKERLHGLEKGWKKSTRLAYLSIPPSVYSAVLNNLCSSGVHDGKSKSQSFRLIVEKPVGTDTKSFEVLRKEIYSCFKPEEIYFLDHYLGKEAVRNVYYLRYANPVIERLLKNTLIDNVQITASETAGIAGRAGYFENVGTFRDMFQSHLLEIAALLTMRLLESDEGMKAARLEALKQLYLPPSVDFSEIIVQAQYDKGQIGKESAISYLDEDDVAKDSRTPTFAAMKLMSRASRWAGVPFYLRSGKRLQKKETRISIEFHASHTLGKGLNKNRLDIILQGEAGMKFFLQTKMGGSEPQFRPLIMEDPLVCVGDCLVEHSLLLLEAINGNQQWFLEPEEIQASWSLIDPVQTYLSQSSTPLYRYKAGSENPIEADQLIEKDGFRWYS